MTKNQFRNLFLAHPNFEKICEFIGDDSRQQIYLKNVLLSSLSIFIGLIKEKIKTNNLIILGSYETANYFYNDLLQFSDEKNIVFFPSSYKRSQFSDEKDISKSVLRTKGLEKILFNPEPILLVSYPEALIENTILKNSFTKSVLNIKQGEELSRSFFTELLNKQNFDLVDFVEKPGQFAIRGSIIDIFSYAEEYPYRIDFTADIVNSIRSFDIGSQLSVNKIDGFKIVPDLSTIKKTKPDSLFSYLKKNCNVWCQNPIIFPESNVVNFQKKDVFFSSVSKYKQLDFGLMQNLNHNNILVFRQKPQPAFNKNFKYLIENLHTNKQNGYQNLIFSDNKNQLERLKHIFHNENEAVNYSTHNFLFHEGFVDDDLKIACFTDHQIFNRYHKLGLTTQKVKGSQQKFRLEKLHELQEGDFVVHIDHGIGKFGGLQKISTNNRKQEAIQIVYKNGDLLYVNLHSLHKISKYKEKGSTNIRIDRLGGTLWKRLKEKAKRKIKDIAKDLIKLYAERKAMKGFAFAADTYMQDELEASFIYEDTPDQETATKDIKVDMESTYPMDRLICGDVGFGKTEVAIRAAFKAVADSKQVAVLVPTTILAFQHFNTFYERLKNFPCTVEYLSRFKSAKEQREITTKLSEGRIDIIIGTHRLVSKDIQFKDLGLLIVDEEQKFGVVIKEKLREFKVNVDTLTLTATPIPRTLQFSLMGARDLSVINTPPPNRYPIITEIHNFNENIIREAILYEVNRGGQVFFMHNRIQNIHKIQSLINRILPGITSEIAHGQMKGSKLENIMYRFMQGGFDVLISTSIIESGLDIPNANTIIIDKAHNFGLSDLYQLRGRVGRSNKKAFCYLLTPPLILLTQQARDRLKAIEEFSDLGSGFSISLKDLEIRGAGNLLGKEQSGYIDDMGLETYQKILHEAMQELKTGKFKKLYSTDDKIQRFVNDCQVDTDFEIYIPSAYIENTTERIKTYRQISNLSNENQLIILKHELEDKFGKIPEKVKKLFDIVRLRWLAIMLGIERLVLKNNRLDGYFVSQKNHVFYQSDTFGKTLNFLKRQPYPSKLNEKNNRLILSIENVNTIEKTLKILKIIISV